MSPYERRLLMLIAVFSIGVVVLGSFVLGLFSPFFCDVTGVNFVTCFTDRENFVRQQAQYYANQESSGGEMAGETPGATQEPQVQPTVELYENLETASSDDPQLSEFLDSLKTAIETKDYQALEGLISDPFNVGPYGSVFTALDKGQALARLKEDLDSNSILVVTTNEGRDVAQSMLATPREASFAVIAYGLPKDGFSILGIKTSDTGYLWSDMIMVPKLPPKE